MSTISSKETQNNFGLLINKSIKELVLIERYGRPAAVIVSHEEFFRYQEFEDLYWSLKAETADKSDYFNMQESMNILDNILKN